MLLWCDGFEHYGTDETNLTAGVYANFGSSSLSSAHPATGSMGLLIGGENFDGSCFRKVLSPAIDKMGVCGRFYFESLPSGGASGAIFDFLSSTVTTAQVSCVVGSSGELRFLRGRNYATISGENGTLIVATDPLITAGANHHIEVQIYIHATAGWIRVAINGVHRFQATNLNTLTNSSKICSVGQTEGITGSSQNKAFWIDDIYYYDFTGNSAIDTDFCPTVDGSGIATNYIGELEVIYLPPNGNTAADAWAKSTGSSAFALVNETTPNDATYISSAAAGDLTELDLTDLPVEITYIRGLQLLGRLSKADAGAANVKMGMDSAGTTGDGTDRPVTVQPTYWWDFMNVDPHSSARWTRSSLNAGKFRITRTA